MRIAILAHFPVHVIPGFEGTPVPPHYATWLPQLSEAFAAQSDFELHWITIARGLPRTERVTWRNQTFHLLSVRYRARMLQAYRKERAAIRATLAELSPGLVHAWGSEDCYGLAASECGRKWVLSLQGLLTYYCRHASMHPLEHLQAFYERRILRRARHLTGESEWVLRQVRPLAPQAVSFDRVEYGVQPLFYELPWQPVPQPVAIFIGTPNARKGTADAVQAFRDPRLAGAELWIVGDRDSAYAKEWQAASGPNVRWLGRHDPRRTAELLAQAWCLVLPTRGDSSPNVVKEARVIGLPVISTPHGGQNDYVVNGANGFLTEPGDIPALADALVKILGAPPADVAAMGAYAHAEQREHFRPENTAKNFLALYRRLLA